MHRRQVRSVTWLSAALLAGALGVAQAQPADTAAKDAPAAQPVLKRTTGNPAKDNLLRLQLPLTQDFNENRLEEVVKYLSDNTGAQLEPIWKTDRGEGFDRDSLITLSFKGLPALTVLEKVLAQVAQELGTETTWQFTDYGTVQIGPKAEMNKTRRVEIYDINDLLFVLPIYDQAPQIDLNNVLQSSGGRGGGGGGQSPFTQTNQQRQQRQEDRENEREERGRGIIQLITSIAEPTQWIDGGGDVPTPRYFQGHIIVDAPDYMHRAVNGYRWWPQFGTSSGQTATRRYVSVNIETGISKIDRIRNVPVTAVVGGRLVRSDGGGG